MQSALWQISGFFLCPCTVELISDDCILTESHQGPNEKRLLNHLFNVNGYNKLERPVRVEKDPLVVTFSLVIQQIIDVVGLQYTLYNTCPLFISDNAIIVMR